MSMKNDAQHYCARHFVDVCRTRARHMRGRICFSHASPLSRENVVVVVLFCLCLWHATALHTTSMVRSNPVQAIFIRQGRTFTNATLIDNPGFVAMMQKTIAARGDVLVLLGGNSNFQSSALELHQSMHKSVNEIISVENDAHTCVPFSMAGCLFCARHAQF